MSRTSTDSILSAILPQTPKIPPHQYFSLESVAGKGFGLIAKCDIKAGTKVLSETALISYDPLSDHGHDVIWNAFEPVPNESMHNADAPRLTETQKKIYLQLSREPSVVAMTMRLLRNGPCAGFISLYGTDKAYFLCILQGIAIVNELPQGVYEVASRFNHSCSPNCGSMYREDAGSAIGIYAVRDIKKGEELTINYYPSFTESRESIIERLLQLRGFLCVCSFCALSPSEKRQLNMNYDRIRRLCEDFSFLLYRIEPKRRMGQVYLEDLMWGRIPHKRALGPLPPSLINKSGEIHLDAACAELDTLLEGAKIHGRDVAQLYCMMNHIVATFAQTRSLAKSGKAWFYAWKWWEKHSEEMNLMGGFNLRGSQENQVMSRYFAEKCRHLR